ncbi:MAG: hypothetical protein COW71_05205 [Ignavibacteriales bacterium CG18_big_fil_WC_8_21_14_2_50_31_20]|nr:MAG: hypothetical protein COW71_05205 [Ignavibacteriales bacterium CG18_big_fil_WC_8_21_14_2_50_31_20]
MKGRKAQLLAIDKLEPTLSKSWFFFCLKVSKKLGFFYKQTFPKVGIFWFKINIIFFATGT